jgi:hypothetical protein
MGIYMKVFSLTASVLERGNSRTLRAMKILSRLMENGSTVRNKEASLFIKSTFLSNLF